MAGMHYDDGYVEDSEGEEDSIAFDAVPMHRNPVPGLPPPPRLPPLRNAADETGEHFTLRWMYDGAIRAQYLLSKPQTHRLSPLDQSSLYIPRTPTRIPQVN